MQIQWFSVNSPEFSLLKDNFLHQTQLGII